METPSDPRTVELLSEIGSPGQAVYAAWHNPGPNPAWHRMMQREVRTAMPVLAAALDRMRPLGN